MIRRNRGIYNNQPYYYIIPSTNEYTYSPQTGMNIPTNQPNEERFGGLLLPALGGFLVGSIVPSPWNRPMYGPPPMMNYAGYGYQQVMPYQPQPMPINQQ